MAFDPSIISQIPDFAPNPIQSKQNTLKLQDLMDTQTLNKMKLKEAGQQQQDEETYKNILKGSDLSTDKGATQAAEKLTQAKLPDYAKRLIKERQDIKAGDLDIQLQKLKIAESQMASLVDAGDTVYRQVEQYRQANPNATPAMLDAKTQEYLIPAMDQISKNDPNLAPVVDKYKLKPGGLTYAGLSSLVTSNKEGLARIQELHAEQKGARDEREQQVREQQANTQAVNAATNARREAAYERGQDSLIRQRNPELLDDKELALAVPSVMADPNRINDYTAGKAASREIKKQVNDALFDQLKAAGMKPEDLPALRARAKAESGSIGKMTAQVNNIEGFEQLAKFNGKRLLELIDKLDDTSIPVIEGPSRYLKMKLGADDAKEFSQVLNHFQTEAARILNTPAMTGVLTEGARQDMQHIIDGSISASQARRIVNRAVAEMDLRKSAFDQQIGEASKQMTPAYGRDTPPPTPAWQTAPAAADVQAPPQAPAPQPQPPAPGQTADYRSLWNP